MNKNSMKQYRSSTIVSIISAFAVGSLIGAGVALLTAPQAGFETRRLIRDKSVELKDRAAGSIEDTRDKANQTVSNIVDKTRHTTDRIRKRSQDTMKSVKEM
jgi:gas vesicle protein